MKYIIGTKRKSVHLTGPGRKSRCHSEEHSFQNELPVTVTFQGEPAWELTAQVQAHTFLGPHIWIQVFLALGVRLGCLTESLQFWKRCRREASGRSFWHHWANSTSKP